MLSTQHKIAIARGISRVTCGVRKLVGKGAKGVFQRKGLRYELDLQEGIDLSIYLFGAFEPDVVACYREVLGEGSVALDIGANVGAHSLGMGALVGEKGRVIAIEPTDWAFEKLSRNVRLNPAIAPRIALVQGFVAADAADALPGEICSSWPLDAPSAEELDISQGREFPTTGARVVTLAGICAEFSLARIDVIKLDVDGHEIEVLEGGLSVIEKFHPAIIIELAPYVFADGAASVRRILEILGSVGYRTAMHGRTPLPLAAPEEIIARIPRTGGINVMVK